MYVLHVASLRVSTAVYALALFPGSSGDSAHARAWERGYICTSFDDHDFSYVSSGEDFNNSPPVEVVLSRRSKMVASVPIPIADDDISEHEQGFIVLLEVASAADPYLVDFSRRKSALCRIRDNDREHMAS